MKLKKKQLGALTLAIAALFFALPVKAQVTIGSEQAPEKNALLDLRENTTDSLSSKGLLLPRVELSSTTASTPLDAHVKGMFVYNTATAGSGTTAVAPGVYYNDGTQWVAAGGQSSTPATTSFKVSSQITDEDYDMTDPSKIVDFLELNINEAGHVLTLPIDNSVPVGKVLYVNNIGKAPMGISPALRNLTYTKIYEGGSSILVYLGGIWDFASVTSPYQ